MPDAPPLRPAVFLDRDGTVIEEVGYLNHLSRFRMFHFAADSIQRLNVAGLPVMVVTNQSGVARGLFPASLVDEVHRDADSAQRGAVRAVARAPNCASGRRRLGSATRS